MNNRIPKGTCRTLGISLCLLFFLLSVPVFSVGADESSAQSGEVAGNETITVSLVSQPRVSFFPEPTEEPLPTIPPVVVISPTPSPVSNTLPDITVQPIPTLLPTVSPEPIPLPTLEPSATAGLPDFPPSMSPVSSPPPELTPEPLPTLLIPFTPAPVPTSGLPDFSPTPESIPSPTPEPSATPSDLIPPTVTTTDPITGSDDIPVDTPVVLHFSEAVHAGDEFASIVILDVNQNQIELTKDLTETTLTLKTNSPFNSGMVYQVILPARSVIDGVGNPLIETFVFSFTTSQPAPVSTLSLPFLGGKPAEMIELPVFFSGYQKTSRIQGELVFNSEVLQFLGILPGEINVKWMASSQILEPGRVRILIQEPDGNPLTGENGTIALIRLLVMKDISAGRESPLNLDNIELTSAKGMSLPVNRVNGAFNVVGIEPTSIPSPTPASSPTPVPTKTPVPTSQNGGQGEGEVISLQVTPPFIEKGRVGEKYSFQVTLPATAQGWRVKLLWIFGDGTKVLSTEDTSVDHVYSKKGQFVLSVKAFNKANGKMIGMQKVKISIDEPKPPLSDNQTVEIEIIPGIRNQQHELQIFREKYSNGKLKVEYSFYTSPDGSEIRQGMETSWYPSGKKKSQGEYLNGQKEGVWISWYENGSQGQKGSYRQNGKEGIWTKYYQNGKIESQGPYKDNRREGKWTKWYEDGRKFAEFKCQNDQIVSGSYKEYR